MFFKNTPPSPIEVLERELKRLHIEMHNYYGLLDTDGAYGALLKEISKINDHLIELSKNENNSSK